MFNWITTYNPNQISNQILAGWELDLSKLQEIPPVMVKQVLESRDMDIPTFHDKVKMIQRLEISNNSVNYDYMWSSEFEFWIVGRTNAKIIEWINSGQAVYITRWEVEAICHVNVKEEVLLQIDELILEEHRLKEPMLLETHSNFLCLDNSYIFSIDWNWKKLLMHLKATDELNKHNEKIRKHPKYIELSNLCEEVKIYLKEKNINIYAIWINVSHIGRKTFWRDLLNEDFEENVIMINASNDRYIREHWINQQDLKDCLEWKWKMYTDRYYLENWQFEFITFLLRSKLSNRILKMDLKFDLARNTHTSKWMLKKIRESCTTERTQRKYERSIRLRGMEVSNIAKKTLANIKTVFLEWKFISEFSWKEQIWHQPSRSHINFINNMSAMWFTMKNDDLNKYYPADTNKEYNQILVWDEEKWWAMLFNWNENYKAIKWCIFLDKLTWEKQLSRYNLADTSEVTTFSFNTYHWDWLVIQKYLENTNSLKNINLHTIFWAVNQLSHTESKRNQEKEIERIISQCKKNVSIENIDESLSVNTINWTYKYLCDNFPWELTENQYLEFAQELDDNFKKELRKLKTYY